MKNVIYKILFLLIELIEKVQYRNTSTNEDNIFDKIKNITFLNNDELYIETPTGFERVEEINETQPFTNYYIKTENGKELTCADNHILFDTLGQQLLVKDLVVGQHIITKDGFEKVIVKNKLSYKTGMIDLSVDSYDMEYYTNNILSHNTITASITILHYCIFNVNKNVMVVANKGETVIEILDKIKNIYKLLPFFLKPGLINWNNKNIVFDNGCRIKSQARSKEPAIGFTIDFLYMDEFAHIPPNIINHYYKAAVPTVSSIKGSKIVITSTPNGANLFKDLVMGASLPKGHPDKNMYNLIKVLWYQVPDGMFEDNTPGTRYDAKLYIKDFEISKYTHLFDFDLTIDNINKAIREEHGFKTVIEEESSDQGTINFIRLESVDGVSDIDTVRTLKLNGINIAQFMTITSWKEQEMLLIGGEENFNQEYNIQFIAGSKRILSAKKAKELDERVTKYIHKEIPYFDKLKFDVSNFRVSDDFDFSIAKSKYFITTIDTSEGLGQDDSVINGFMLEVKDNEWLKENKIKNLYDAFYLKQMFIYNFSLIDPKKELAELFYCIHFDLLNPDKTKSVLELNGSGNTLLAALPGVFENNNLFGKYIFVKFKHKVDDLIRKVGLKVSRNKKEKVKDYISCIEVDKIYVDEEETLSQMENFIKVPTKSGDVTYKADSGHDDIVMTLVNLSQVFDSNEYKALCQQYYRELSSDKQKLIESALDLNYNPTGLSFKSVSSALKKSKYKKRR